jgi:hypothetical protein
MRMPASSTAREPFIFAKEPVAGVDRLGAGFLRDGDDLARRAGSSGATVVVRATQPRRPSDMARIAVGFRVDGHGGDAHPAGCFDDPTGDLAAVGDRIS